MALIHEKLYQSEDFAYIDFNKYIADLTDNLFRIYNADPGKIALTLNIGNVSLGLDDGIPCGLIINELISNSLKYAFPGNSEGEIRIGLRSINENKFELSVSDNGIGLPDGLDFRNTETIGLRLVTILAEDQLEASINNLKNKYKFLGRIINLDPENSELIIE